MTDKRWLVVIETPFRGDLERTYLDTLYQTRVFYAQFRGAVDILVRGDALMLVRRQIAPVLPDEYWGHAALEGMAGLLSDGATVLVEVDSFLPLEGAWVLREDVTRVKRQRMASKWSDYEAVLFF